MPLPLRLAFALLLAAGAVQAQPVPGGGSAGVPPAVAPRGDPPVVPPPPDPPPDSSRPDPRKQKQPPARPRDAAKPLSAEDEELVRDLAVLERMELLRNLDLFEPDGTR